MITALLGGALLASTAAGAAPAHETCDNKPVIMHVAGILHDRDRIIAYGAAIRASGLYEKLGGYYVNNPRSVAVFEGTPAPASSILMVRFPCLAHARAFWYSKTYQKTLKPLRQNPSAGDFTVTVYPEAAPPPGVAAQLQPGGYRRPADPAVLATIPQIADKPD